MRKQIHKRLPKDFVEDVIRTFCEEKIGREQACELLGLSRSELYWWREKYLASAKKKEEFKLYNREVKPTRSFTPDVENFFMRNSIILLSARVDSRISSTSLS